MKVTDSKSLGQAIRVRRKELNYTQAYNIGNFKQQKTDFDYNQVLHVIEESRPEEKEMMVSVVMNCMR